jgi:two-component system, NtrC family, sensor kinase
MGEWINILCVDDEPNVLSSLKRLFMDEPYTILTATSAGEGLELLAQNDVQIVMSDYRMPVTNGVDFLSEVRKRWPNTVRIVLSGYADTASIVSAINEGQVYKFIPKPWNDDELKMNISNAIERYYLFKKNTELSAELKILLDEKSRSLELRSLMLETNQHIVYSLPVPVLGIDNENVVAQCNLAWAEETGDHWKCLGQFVEHALPEDILRFLVEVKEKHKSETRTTMNGISGRLFGAALWNDEEFMEFKCYLLVFIRDA